MTKDPPESDNLYKIGRICEHAVVSAEDFPLDYLSLWRSSWLC